MNPKQIYHLERSCLLLNTNTKDHKEEGEPQLCPRAKQNEALYTRKEFGNHFHCRSGWLPPGGAAELQGGATASACLKYLCPNTV